MIRTAPILAAALAGALVVSGAAAAQETGKNRTVTMFTKLDKNADGVVDKAEFDVVRVRTFDKLDTNKDGRLLAAEVEAVAAAESWPEKRLNRLIRRIGLDVPQGVTKDEYLARKSMFERIDVDGDGKVTLTEVETFVVKMKDRRAAKAAKQAN